MSKGRANAELIMQLIDLKLYCLLRAAQKAHVGMLTMCNKLQPQGSREVRLRASVEVLRFALFLNEVAVRRILVKGNYWRSFMRDACAKLQLSGGGQCCAAKKYTRLLLQDDFYGGGGRNRTGIDGFAIRCITILLPRRAGSHQKLRIPEAEK